jgi:hypothetical protein
VPFVALAQSADVFRKDMINLALPMCDEFHAEAIKNPGVRQQYCQCVYTDYYKKMSDERIAQIMKNIRKLVEANNSGREVQATRAELEQEKIASEKDEQNLLASEKACKAKSGISAPTMMEILRQGK